MKVLNVFSYFEVYIKLLKIIENTYRVGTLEILLNILELGLTCEIGQKHELFLLLNMGCRYSNLFSLDADHINTAEKASKNVSFCTSLQAVTWRFCFNCRRRN